MCEWLYVGIVVRSHVFVQEVDESLGLADKLHLVKQVAQTVQVSVAHTHLYEVAVHGKWFM